MPRLMRKIAMTLSVMMMVQVFAPVTKVYALDTVDVKAQGAKGNISTAIRFDYPFAYKKVKEQTIKVSLKKGNTSLVEIEFGDTPTVTKNPGNYPVEIVARNTHGVEMTTEDVIGSYYINIKNLDLGTYQFVYEGEGYKTYTSEDIVISDYSKNVTVGTGDATFSYGDINGDQKITEDDLKAIEQNIKNGIHDHDINGDNKVDIVELTYIKQQIEAEGVEVQTDLAAIISQNVIATVDESIKDAGLEIAGGGSVADLFTGESQVKIQKTSDEGKLEIPINLGDEGIEAQVIELVSPVSEGGLEGGTIIVEYEEDGVIKREEQAFGSSVPGYRGIRSTGHSEDKNKIVINLGKRVPVKRVTVSVDKVVGEDGNPNYVVMEEVSFVKDIASNVSPNDKTAIKNVTLTEKNEEIVLEWDPVPNVEGYRVFYGETPGNYTDELNVDEAYASVQGLENLTPYYFVIRATSDEWMGTPSEEYRGIPQPSSRPLPPDFLKVEEMNAGLTLSWGKTENATYYKVFYKEASADDTEYKQFIPAGSNDGKITATSSVIGGLTNDVEYNLYVVAGNNIGESKPSLVVTGTPEKVALDGPVLPSKNRISVDEITDVKLGNPNNVAKDLYPNGFNTTYDPKDTKDGIKNVVDGDYATHWTARVWWESKQIITTFETPHEMDYMIYVPRVDGRYTDSIDRYHITVWGEDDDLSGPGKQIVKDKKCNIRTDEDGKRYAVLSFPKTKVKKIAVEVLQWDGSPTNISASELAFYDYYSVDSEIKALFADDAFTTLVKDVTKEDIDAIRVKLDNQDSYYVDSAIFADELNLAEALLANDTSKLGIMKNSFVSIDASKDVKRINDWSPLGLVGFAGKKMTIYADIPEGEKLEIIPTQYYSEANSLSGKTIELVNGRNIIDIEKIGNLRATAGGSFYYRYSGSKGDQIKLHIRDTEGAIKEIPTLELYDWYKLNETERKARISKYIDDLVAYAPNKLNNKDVNPANSTEISGRNVLLSLPADQVLAGITAATPERDAQIEKLYNNMLTWEEAIKVTHITYGLDDPLNVLKSRQNIRYMRMFGKAFMYAAGSHIGVGYGSTSALVQGKPTSVTGEGNANGLFGWGIGHEIGHNMDRLGKAEITNNIYSILLQTYDGKDNALPSRLETSNKYEEIYKKVAVGDKGMANDVFVQLGMYWQLHLAYDNGADDQENGPLNFYNKLFKVYDSGKVNDFTGDDKFAVAASMVAKKDLTEFFTKWGADLSDAAKAEMKKYSKEERKIQYLTDESRRYRLNDGAGIYDMEFTATASVVDSQEDGSNANKVNITINPDEAISSKDLLGYEIFRDGKQVAFITGTNYEDVIGSANNKAFKYEVRAIDSLGNIINKGTNDGKVNAGQVRIEHDNVIDRSAYSIEFVGGENLTTTGPALTTTGPALILTFNKQTPVTGIRVKAKDGSSLPSGTFNIEVGRGIGNEYSYSTAKKGDFKHNEAVDTSKFITYFNKPGAASEDTRIWTYDADVIRITGENIDEDFLDQFNVEPLSYPGDNVAFEDYKIGIMGQDYHYDDVDGMSTIEEGTLIIVGTYRGDPLYNTIHILGKYAEKSGLDDEITYTERPINGELLMFAEVPEDGETSDISDGLFIFIPDIQKEEELQGDCAQLSVLPTEIMAKMYRYDSISHTGTPRTTSTTLWYGTPSYDSMPEIILNQGATSLIQEDMYEEN